MTAAVRALLVEDDARIRRVLALALADDGIEVIETGSAEQALAVLDDGVAVALVDLMLPGADGLALCRAIRARRDLPIIVVTARADTDDVIAGLEAGADDYVTKPVVPGELVARIRALLRRTRPAAGPPAAATVATGSSGAPGSSGTAASSVPGADEELMVGPLCIRPERGEVRRDGEPVALTRTELRLLVELARAGGRIVGREELLARVWGHGYFGDTRLLDVHVRRLRRKVEPDPDHPTVVLTVRGSGYRTSS